MNDMPNPPIRATLDPAVIDAWSLILAAHRRRYGVTYTALTTAGLAFLGLALWRHGTAYGIGAVACMNIALMVDHSARDGVRCPHCGEQPFLSARHSSITSLEWCERCLYWLRKPY